VEEFTGEEMGSTPSEVEPQHLAPDDSMLYDLDLRDCSADAGSLDLEFEFTVAWQDPLTGQAQVDSVSRTVAELLAAPHRELVKASALVTFAQAFEAMVDVPWVDKADYLQGVIDELTSASVAFPTDLDLPEVLALAEAWQDLYP
jgi:Ca-activated chloride channel family protein